MSLAAPGTNPASNLELKLPHTIGSANQLLKVDGSGQLGWATDSTTDSTKLPLAGGTLTGTLNIGNGSITTGSNFSLNGNALTVTGSSGTVIEGKRAGSATIQATNTTDSTDLQLRADSTGGLVRTASNHPLVFGTSQTERMRIENNGTLVLKNNSNMMIDLQSSAGTGSAWIEFSDTDGTRKGYFGYGSSGSEKVYWVQSKAAPMSMYSNGNDRFEIQSDGKKIVKNGNLNINSTYIDFSGNISTPQTGAAIFRPASDTLAFSINNSERLRIDSSGKVGIGTTSPSSKLHIVETSGAAILNLEASANGGEALFKAIGKSGGGDSRTIQFRYDSGGDAGRIITAENIPIQIMTQNTTRVHVKGDGDVYIGHTTNNAGSNGRFYVQSVGGQSTADLHHSANDNQNVLNCIHGGVGVNGNPTRVMVEWRNFNNNAIATIQSNSSTVTYGTGSDYRMKENQVDISDGITRVKQLKPYRFNWKSDYGGGDKVDGFFAHEAATVVPESVLGDKDAVDSDGNIIRQQIDQAKLVPLLTAALKEAITKIETLETKVAALEAG